MTLQTWMMLILGTIAVAAFLVALVVYGLDYRKEGSAMTIPLTARTRGWLVVLSLLILSVAAMVIFYRQAIGPAVPARLTVQPTDRDLFFFNEPRHDAARARAFRSIISATHRCDEVRSAVQDQREGWAGSVRIEAVWDVSCSPGASYRLAFDPDGLLLKLDAQALR